MKKSNNKIHHIFSLTVALLLAEIPGAVAAISVTVASPNSSSGLIVKSDQVTINTSGFVRVGKLTTATPDATKNLPTFANYQYWDSIFVDVNSASGGGGITPSTWNFNSSGALSGSATGVSASTFPTSTQLWIWAFNFGSLTSGSTGGIPVFSSSDFGAGKITEWAIMSADEWIAPADNLAKSLVINQVGGDTVNRLIAGTDLGNNIAMIPEPSSYALLLSALGFMVLSRVGRLSKKIGGGRA
ncbi:PEP-CTERM sorting domain-containing protein [bacterium]|nr:PEP-CTERM sorting domain-containing protein [bacterium]